MGRVIQAFEQFFADDGSPLALGWLRFTESGTNNTDKNTFVDENLSIPNANPLQLDAAGRCPDVFGTGKYRVTSFTNDPEDEDSPGEQIQVKDPVLAETSGAGGGQAGFEAWSNVTTYQLGDIVYYNNVLYRSIIVDNLNNNPAIEDAAWEQVDFLRYWNENITYAADDLVIYSGNLYLSKSGSNLNYQPDERFDFWRPVASDILAVESKTDNYTILLLERDYMFVLGAATLTDKTFTLPLISSSYDGFRVWITNDSDYNLSVTPQGTSSIWLEDPVIIQKGAILGLRYNASLDTWQAFGNAGPILGSQDIGTAATPVVDIYGNSLILPNIALAADLSLNDDIPIHLGDDDDVSLIFTSATPAFDITSTEDVNLNLATGKDFFINVNSVNHWVFDATGPLLPGASNPLADIGSSSAYIDDIYCDTININTFQRINWNAGNDMTAFHNSTTTGYLTVNTGNLQLTNADVTGSIYFQTNGGIPLSMGPGVDCDFSGNISLLDDKFLYFGATNDFSIRWDNTGNEAELTSAGEILFTVNTSTQAGYFDTQGDLFLSHDITIAEDNFFYLGGSGSYISKASANNTTYIVSENDIILGIDNGGTLKTGTINDIGTAVPSLSATDAYIRVQISGTNYYFVGYAV